MHGAVLARRVAAGLGPETTLYIDRRFSDPCTEEETFQARAFDLPLRPLLRQVWEEFEAVVLFLPVGAAVRLVAPMLNDKRTDPALVCVDDGGRFAISVVSGHLGGADSLAERVAAVLGAEAVITSGSHATQTIAVDLLGREFGWTIEAESAVITRASAAVVNREAVGIFQTAGEPNWWPASLPLSPNIRRYDTLDALSGSGCAAALVITDERDPYISVGTTLQDALRGTHVVLYRPRSLVVGMGCRRGVPVEELERLLVDTFEANNLSLSSLECLATATLKRDELGLLALAEKYSASFSCYEGDVLNSVYDSNIDLAGNTNPAEVSCASPVPDDVSRPGELHPSSNARRLVGVWGVAEPAALLASGASRLLVSKQTASRATIAVARREYAQGALAKVK
ncbi:Cobalt-precorrin-5A hydrolase [Geodia barretti]|uniref:Cobalt-precorrin-5A hydrolase n=1 Tax=Geodia barretti TaxID=519541 RepID=A0AA35WXC2_GEOBA|nr:Cobalt-precorrin-5A hydrolase [Geodia barretti]